VVNTEIQALLFGNNLIKKYKLRYNTLLKGDKIDSWICIKKSIFFRIFMTRRLVKYGAEYKSIKPLQELFRFY
jgi:excinuclease UvrABC nuclease subunit